MNLTPQASAAGLAVHICTHACSVEQGMLSPPAPNLVEPISLQEASSTGSVKEAYFPRLLLERGPMSIRRHSMSPLLEHYLDRDGACFFGGRI